MDGKATAEIWGGEQGTDRRWVLNGEAGGGNLAAVNRVQTGDGWWTGRWRRKFDGDEEGYRPETGSGRGE